MVSVCLKRIEAFAGFVKLDLKIQGRRQAQPLACPIRSVPEIPHKAGRATLLLGIPGSRSCLRAACPAVQGWGARGTEHTEQQDAPAIPAAPTGAR